MSEFVYFGDFEVNLKTREIRKNGVRIRLRGKPLQMLLDLLEKPGEIVTRQHLTESLWPAGTNVEFDSNLKTALSKLRRELEDSATNPRYIETISGVGFRFIEPVTRKDSLTLSSIGMDPQESSKSGSPNPTNRRDDHYESVRDSLAKMGIAAWRRAILATLALLLAGGAVFLPVRSERAQFRSTEAHSRVVIVIPFEDVSKDAPSDGLADEVTAEMTAALQTRLPKLAIIARKWGSEFQHGRNSLDIMSKELGGVDYVLEGAIRRVDDIVNLDVRLIRVADNRSVWAGTFEHKVSDLQAFRRDIPAQILEPI